MRDVIGLLEAYGEHAEATAHPVELDEIMRPVDLEDVIERRPAPPLTPFRSPPRWVVALVAAVVGLALIGGVALLMQGSVEEESPVITQAPAPTVTTVPAEPSTTLPAPETTLPTATTTLGSTGSRLGPPTAFDPPEIYPPVGLSLMVVGLAHDGELNVREGPGLTPIVTTLGPMDTVISAGEGRELPTTTWWKVDVESDTLVDGTIGWVNASYLASWSSARYDLTPYVLDDSEMLPIAGTMADLGGIVAEALVNDEYPSRTAMVVEATAANPGYATFDVVSEDPLGLRVARTSLEGQRAWRLWVTGAPDNGSFRLESVEGQALLHACACWER